MFQQVLCPGAVLVQDKKQIRRHDLEQLIQFCVT